MRTNIEIDDDLMDRAMKASGAQTKRQAVELGLEALVRLRGQDAVRGYRGKLDWSGDLNAIRTDA